MRGNTVAIATDASELCRTLVVGQQLAVRIFGLDRQRTVRDSIGLSADWRVAPQDVLTFGFQYAFFSAKFWVRQLNFATGTVASSGQDFTQGANGTGSAIAKTGGDTWFFLTADYAFGHTLEKDTTDVLKAEGRTLDETGLKAFHQWIRQAIAQNRPMDQFVREMISSRGSTPSQMP